jgi:hypothetical protein
MTEIRGDNLGNTHMINVDNASALEQEKGNEWYCGSVVKLKHTTTTSKPCVNIVMTSKGYLCAYFHTQFLKYSHLRYIHAGTHPGLPHTVCFPARMPYITSHTAQLFGFRQEALKRPDVY